MDIFYNNIPGSSKLRLHFYRFMQKVHINLKKAQDKGIKNPLQRVAKQFRQEAKILCFDEFFVSDVTDAMIMAELLKYLFDEGVILFATSNTAPDNLYRNGVHRDRFLPAIELIKQKTEVLTLDGAFDYRLRVLKQAEVYYFPITGQSEQKLKELFFQLVPDFFVENTQIEINSRLLDVYGVSDDVLWCSFNVLCKEARSQYDYIEIAHDYHTVLLSRLPKLTEETNDQARRFISLIDEFYDRRVKLIISAETSIVSLYTGRMLSVEFERTKSRLIEMGSEGYLSAGHKA